MTGGNAMKPGDVLRYSNGVTAEVLNTDAEGRLVLADALIYANKLKPDQIVDFATLTGAAIAALGMNYSILMGEQGMVDAIKNAGEKSGEPMWQLPLPEAYKSHIKSRIADIKNIGNGGEAGTITAALFLERFVSVKNWVHVDIAGPAFLNSPDGIHPAQAPGTPVRAMIEYLKGL
jgi:leucyl aminopeptidase